MGGIGSGRTTNELKKAQQIKTTLELVSNEALIELAKSKVFNQVRQLGRSRKALKNVVSIALPIYLKSIKTQTQVDVVEVKPLLSAIRGEISEPKQLEEQLSAKAVEAFQALDDAQLCDTNATQATQHTTPPLNEPIINE